MLIKKELSTATAAVLIAGALAAAAPATADQGGVKAGFLTCNVASGWGFVFGSSRELKCTYSAGAGSYERYTGHIKRFGADIGYQASGVVVWAVFAPATNIGKGALAGDYGGAGASGSAGVGVGGHVLVGGFQHSFTLQPVSLEGATGLNVAAGIEAVTLDYQP